MARRLAAGLQRSFPVTGLLAAVLAVGLVGHAAADDLRFTITSAMVDLVVVVGLAIFVGNSGAMSFGHIAFMAVGAYVSALLTVPEQLKGVILPDLPGVLEGLHLPGLPAALAAGLAGALLAAAVGLTIVRMSLAAIPIATLSLLIIVNTVASNWDAVTGGTGSLTGVPTDTTLMIATAWALVTVAVAYAFKESALGLRLRASREDALAARGVGIGIFRERLAAFALGAFFVAIGGHLSGHQLGTLAPSSFFFDTTFLALAMLVVGGRNSVAGAVVGTTVVSVVSELLRRLEAGEHLGPLSIGHHPGLRYVGLALVLIVVLALRPDGITGGRELRWPGRRRARTAPG